MQLRPGEELKCLARLAHGWLAQNDKAAAIRLWGRIVDRDRSYTEPLDELANGGLRAELTQLYEILAKQEPACSAAGSVKASLLLHPAQ